MKKSFILMIPCFIFWAAAAWGQGASDPIARQFENPGPEWRGKPFWAWNGDLKIDELKRQIGVFKEMGMGGFFMHSRSGLVTEYLGKDWFEAINACADEAQKQGLEAWLYDEDRWPSGTAGGMVTLDPKYRMRFLTMQTLEARETKAGAGPAWDPNVIAAFAVQLGENRIDFANPKRLDRHDGPQVWMGQDVLVFRVETMTTSTFYNGSSDVDRLSREATDQFIRLTHEKYREQCGARLGSAIKGIFTDEPNYGGVLCGASKTASGLPAVPWTEKLPERFKAKYQADLIEQLPALFLRPDGQKIVPVKWQYMDLLNEMFLDNFMRPIQEWCRRNKILFTGHDLHEDSLAAQSSVGGSMMRFYEYMDVPGVDVLSEGNRNYWIVKQLSSAARQLGRKWMMSELYGCTGWQMGFEGHKAVGDWQALFGINLRCPHLSWYTMGGQAKRDYPASIFYQSAWWRDYKHVEDYYARLGLLLAQGKPACDVLVINPIESVWAQIYGQKVGGKHIAWAQWLQASDPDVKALEEKYQSVFKWLAGAQIDFDYADEGLLTKWAHVETGEDGKKTLYVGQAPYKVVVLAGAATLRETTLNLLGEFVAGGGYIVTAGDLPAYVDAAPNPSPAQNLSSYGIHVDWNGPALVDAVSVGLTNPVQALGEGEKPIEDIYCQMRQDGERRWLVAMNVNPKEWRRGVRMRVKGPGALAEWDCEDGTRHAVAAEDKDGTLEWKADFAPSGEHAWLIAPEAEPGLKPKPELKEASREEAAGPFEYALSEPNVCVLDLARWCVDKGDWAREDEVLKVDENVRGGLHMEVRGGEMLQPWFKKKMGEPPVKGKVRLGFDFEVEQAPKGDVALAMEQPERWRVTLNGKPIDSKPLEGWWIDNAFKRLTVPAGAIKPGANAFEMETDFREDTNIEAIYLVGDFGVRLDGTKKIIGALPAKLSAGSLVGQGLPFYGGVVTYKVPVAKAGAGERIMVSLPELNNTACIRVGKGGKLIAWQPYEADVTDEAGAAGAVELGFVLTRRNTFGPLHINPMVQPHYGPPSFTTKGKAFTMNYQLYPSGMLKPPVLVKMKE